MSHFQAVTRLTSRIAGVGSVRYEDIPAAGQDPHRWLTYSGSYDEHRFGPNNKITIANASNLRLLWMRQYTTSETLIETSPLIVDGFMFITVPPNRVEALDAKTGCKLWPIDTGGPIKAGPVRTRSTASSLLRSELAAIS